MDGSYGRDESVMILFWILIVIIIIGALTAGGGWTALFIIIGAIAAFALFITFDEWISNKILKWFKEKYDG